uniref:Uncharacterized protein n=1 Tax=Spongospora subterranea TaxID=70186 RepID=A0A0H5QG07_9EUKA|eukprot:CRZ00988.1 hypothetical protein [Spongospora subterranea]
MPISIIREAIALGCVVLLGSLASGAGVGGGSLYIPLFVLLLTPEKLAIPLSKACAFGASIALYIVNSRKTRDGPNGTTRPLIDYRMALLLEPFTLLGTMIGVRLNKLLPFPVVAVMMAILLTLISVKTYHKALAIHRTESASAITPLSPTTPSGDVANEDEPPSNVKPEPQFPFYPIAMLLFYWIIGIFPSVALSGRFNPQISCMSSTYIAIFGSSFMFLFILACVNAKMEIQRNHQRHDALLYEGSPDEPSWSTKSVISLSAISTFAGVFSALVGVGGSAIKGPFLAHIAAPDVAASTAAFMLLSTCSSSMFQFILVDMLDLHYAAVFFVAGFVAAFCGSHAWAYIVTIFEKKSIIVFLLASYVSIATIAMAALSIYEIQFSGHQFQMDSAC